MNTTVILKNGVQVTDEVSQNELEGMHFAFKEFIKSSYGFSLFLEMNGRTKYAVFAMADVSAISSSDD